MRAVGAALTLVLLASTPATAQGSRTLGFSSHFNNDLFGDGLDRWRTSSFVLSWVRGQRWDGVRPESPFGLLDYRFRSEIIAPDNLNGPGARSRPYAGILSFGAHTHFSRGPLDASVGADLVVIGPQTGQAELQDDFHDLIDAQRLDQDGNEIENTARLHGTAELAWPLSLGGRATMRPYLEMQAGAETLVRMGGDLVIGEIVQDDLLLRDPVTGQLYRGTQAPGRGFAYMVGADYTYIDDSLYLPEDGTATLTEDRTRVRAGVLYQGGRNRSVFYGMTYLSEEFDEQDEGQVVGSLNITLDF